MGLAWKVLGREENKPTSKTTARIIEGCDSVVVNVTYHQDNFRGIIDQAYVLDGNQNAVCSPKQGGAVGEKAAEYLWNGSVGV